MTSMVLSAVQTGNVWQPNMLMLYWVARRLQERLNGQNVLQRLIKCSPSFKYYWTWSNAIKQSIQTGKCLVAKQCSVVFFCLFFRLVFFKLEFHTLLTELTFLIHCVWLPNIFHLNRALYIFQNGENRQNFILYTLILWNQGSCMVFAVFCCLITFFVSAEGRRKDPEEFWSISIVDRLKSDHEEALASQQETQMIFFIQQVAKNSKKKVQP